MKSSGNSVFKFSGSTKYAFAAILSAGAMLGQFGAGIAHAGGLVGGGGDAYAQEFTEAGQAVLQQLKDHPSCAAGRVDLVKLENAVSRAYVTSAPTQILNGVEVDAINYPTLERIDISRPRWDTIRGDKKRTNQFALHEYLALSDVDDARYAVSNPIMKCLNNGANLTALKTNNLSVFAGEYSLISGPNDCSPSLEMWMAEDDLLKTSWPDMAALSRATLVWSYPHQATREEHPWGELQTTEESNTVINLDGVLIFHGKKTIRGAAWIRQLVGRKVVETTQRRMSFANPSTLKIETFTKTGILTCYMERR